MAVHKPFDRTIVLAPHAELANVGSTLLKPGMFGIYDEFATGADGMKPVTSFVGRDKNEKRYVIRTGGNSVFAAKGKTNKAWSSQVFSINEIVSVWASAPKRKEMAIDDVILGYNGNDDKTAFTAKKGQKLKISLHVWGRQFEIFGLQDGVWVNDYIDFDDCNFLPNACEECDPCDPIDCLEPTLKAIERLKRRPVIGTAVLEDFVDITPVHKCTTDITEGEETSMYYHCLEVCDTGDDLALGNVQRQYPGMNIKRVDRAGSISKYQVLTAESSLADYQMKLSSIMKGCANCPEGYDTVEGGLIYSITLKDAGSTTDDSGDEPVTTDDNIAIVEAFPNAVADSAERQDGNFYGLALYTVVVSAHPTDAEIKEYAEANPGVTVKFVAKTEDMCSDPTVEEIEWAQCGECKVSTESYYITLPDDECGNSRLAELQAAYPDLTITNYGTPAGCMHSFQTSVVTSMVCAECDDVFKDYHKGEAPAPYKNHVWQKIEAVTPPAGCKCGIRFRSKTFSILPSDCLECKIAYNEDATRISVEGGYVDEFVENAGIFQEPMAVTWISNWEPVTHRGANLKDDELEARAYFTGELPHLTYMEREFMNEQSLLDQKTQYADFAVTLLTERDSNGLGRREYAHTTIHFLVEYGAHAGVMAAINMMAAAAKLNAVKV